MMKKFVLVLALFAGLTLTCTSNLWAQANKTTAFKVQASVPLATGVNIVATRVLSAGNVFGAAVTELNFNPMAFDPVNNIFFPDHYFVIDVGTTGGAGNPSINVKYAEGLNPNGDATKGLGAKTTIALTKITFVNGVEQAPAPIAGHPAQKRLIDLTGAGETITPAQISGGFFRGFVGVFTGPAGPDTPAGTQVFSTGDAPGTYDGTLTVSATVS